MEKMQHFSIRKLSIGAASVLIGISFLGVKVSTVKADSLQNASATELTKSKAANEAIEQNTGSNIEQEPTSDIKKDTSSNIEQEPASDIKQDTSSNIEQEPASDIKQDTSSNIKQEPVSKTDAKQITSDQPNAAQAPAKLITLKPNSNQQNAADLEAKPQTPDKVKLRSNRTITPNKAGQSKVKVTNLMAIAGKKLNAQMLSESKVASPAKDTNGGFDEATWGTLDVNAWQGNIQGDYYQLTDYTGDANHIIVPNEADFEKAGISTSGKQVGVTSSLMHTIFRDNATAQDATVAFSKTGNKMVKAIGADWSNTWGHRYHDASKAKLSKFDGTNLDVSNVTDMQNMFHGNQISDLSSLANWNVDQATNMAGMFFDNQISDLSPLANWNVDQVTDMGVMFQYNQISDLSPLANWNVDRVIVIFSMFSDNSSLQITNLQAKRIINFVYPDGYTGKKQDPVTQTVDVPQQVKVELTTGFSKPSNNILDWVTKTETPETPAPVYFQDYTVPKIKGLLEPDQTVISRQQADIAKPINVTVTYKLVDSNTNDAYALDSKNGLHEHANVNDNGGYDEDYWGKINVDNWNYMVNGDRIEINSLKDGISTGANDAVIVPNLDDFKLAGKDGGAKTVYISGYTLGKTAKHKYYGLSKTNGNTFATDSNLAFVFYNDSNLTHADLNGLDTSSVTDMSDMFNNASSLKALDVSKWDTSKVTDMHYMFNNASSLMSLDVSNWDTSKVTDMHWMFNDASSLKNLDVSNWDTSKVTNMHCMFSDASSLTSLNVSNWKTGNVTDMSDMFYGASGLTDLDVSNWDTGKVTDMHWMFNDASSLKNLDVSKWDTSKVTNMGGMFSGARNLALIVNRDKFADYLVKNNFDDSDINDSVKSVTTDNTKLLQLLTNDSQHNSATKTVVFTFPTGYSPDLTKYHLIKVGSTYQIKQSADYDKPYVQGTVLINATDDITEHHIDTTKPNKLSDTWQPNYNKLVLAHKNSDGSVSFDTIRLPKVPGYKAVVKTVANPINPASALFAVSFIALPKPATPAINDTKPAEIVSPATTEATETVELIKPAPKITTSITLNVINLSNDVVTTTPDVSTWQVADEPSQDTYHVSNGQYAVELPHISNTQLHVIANGSTKDSILFTYKGQNTKYVFNIKFVDGYYLLTTYEIKSGKLVKLIDYNFIKSSKMIDVILDWLQFK